MKKNVSHRYWLFSALGLFILSVIILSIEENESSDLYALGGWAILLGLVALLVGAGLWVRHRSEKRQQESVETNSELSRELETVRNKLKSGNKPYERKSLLSSIGIQVTSFVLFFLGFLFGIDMLLIISVIGIFIGLILGLKDDTQNDRQYSLYYLALNPEKAGSNSESKNALIQLGGIVIFILAYLLGQVIGLIGVSLLSIVYFSYKEQSSKKKFSELKSMIKIK